MLLCTGVDVAYPQAVSWIAEGMAPLGDAYVEALKRGSLEERWVDIYPNQGKGAGAVQHTCAGRFQGPHQREREGNGSGVASDVGAGARLVEIQACLRQPRGIKRISLQVVRGKQYAAPLQRRKERLLPFRMLVNNHEVGSHDSIFIGLHLG